MGASIIPEIIIDLFGVSSSSARQFHGRHGPRNNAILSWGQTVMFAAGVIPMGMAMKRPWDTAYSEYYPVDPFFREKDYRLSWEQLFLMSSIFMTVAGILSVASAGCCCCSRRPGVEIGNRSQVLVQSSSIMFLVAPAVLLFAIAIDGFCAQCFSGYFLVMLAFCLWIGCGVMWIIADALLPREEDGIRQEEQEEERQQSDTEEVEEATTKPEVPVAVAVGLGVAVATGVDVATGLTGTLAESPPVIRL